MKVIRLSIRLALVALATGAFGFLAGCIADSAEDSELPWASGQKWEGMAPIAPSITDRYD